MPQFDPNVWPTQLFWLAVIFAILVFIMAKYALPPIATMLEEREVRIEDRLRKAEHLKHDAEDAAAAYDKMIADARAEAQALARKVTDEAQQEASKRHAELAEKLHQQVEAAEARIAKARDEAIAGLKDVATDLVGDIVQRLVGETFDRGAITATVATVMKEAV
jgi:F-type H+-transporting ATPase subunit b